MHELLDVTTLADPEPRHVVLRANGVCCPSCGAGYQAGDSQCQYCREPVTTEPARTAAPQPPPVWM